MSIRVLILFAVVLPSTCFAWGPEGHKTIAIMAAHFMRPETRARVHRLLGAESMEEASLWADTIAHSTRTETASWHYIDIPLQQPTLDLNRDCPDGACVLLKTGEFLGVLANPQARVEDRRDALKFVLHFMADLHQPLHCEDNHDKGGNQREVIFEGHPDNLHWVWDTGLVQELNPDAPELSRLLERNVSERDRSAWVQGDVQDWIMESHRLAQTMAYRSSWGGAAPTLDRNYDERAGRVVEVQIEKASVRLAYLLDHRLM